MSWLRTLGLGALSAGSVWGSLLFAQGLQMPEAPPTVDALESAPPGGLSEWPFVSVIVPARNEERNLPVLLPTLLAQRYPNYEVLVVDDKSTDATPDILAEWARRDPRLRVVQGNELPSDGSWKGKPHAMHQGAQSARGEWFLFTDADTRHSPFSVSSSIAYALAHDVDLFTIGPQFDLVSPAEKLIMPVAYEGISILYAPAKVNNPKSRTAIANGQYILIKSSVYATSGGIERVKDCIAEDLEFGKTIKHDGYRLWLGDGRHLMSVRMYTNFREVWEGWSKNVVLSLRGNPAQALLAVQGAAALTFMPVLMVRWAWLASRTARKSGKREDEVAARWIGALTVWNVAVPLLYRARIDRMLGLSPGWTLTQPVGGALFVLIMLSSLVRILTGKGVTWKGRTYTGG